MKNNDGKSPVVMITGASAGVGRATAQAFAKRGASIGLIARGRERLEAARREVEELGGRALAFPGDVADSAIHETAADAVENEFGPIDIWVNNAMVSVFSPVSKMVPEDFKRVTDVTYLGYVWGTMAALKRMKSRNRGIIIQVGSALAYRGIPLQSAYCAAKHAIQGFNDSLRSELLSEQSNVELCMVQLPAVNTPQFNWVKSRLPCKAQPVPPVFQPEVAADAILYTADYPRRELYVGWPTVKAIVGNKIAPGYGDHYLAQHGFDSQQRDVPADPNQPNNLMEPAPGNFSAHGDFDAIALPRSNQLWFTKNRHWLLSLGAMAIAITAALATPRKNGS